MKEFLVTWDINIEAETPMEAAQKALELMMQSVSPDFFATIFTVLDEQTRQKYLVDLEVSITEEL